MESPISLLWGNIIHTFENIDDSSLNEHKKQTDIGSISKLISYDLGHQKVKLPYANKETREINLQETYLAYLWSLIYSIFVMYEEGIQKPLINKTFDGSLNFDTPILKRAKLLYDWSISLTNQWSEWNEELPNPKRNSSDKERFYAEKTNGIFQYAVTYLMFHEFAHLTLKHDSFFQVTK